MTWWEALVLGVVQGITEFFPVSSSGHLVLAQRVLGVRLPGIGFEVVVHLATLLSVLVVYQERVTKVAAGCLRGERESWEYVTLLAAATVPAIVLVLVAGDRLTARFDEPTFAATMLLVTGTFLWSTRWVRGGRPGPVDLLPPVGALVVAVVAGTVGSFLSVLALLGTIMLVSRLAVRRAEWSSQVGWGGALAMGVTQAAAILPGISRSGSTVVTALWKRVDPLVAAEFSFLMSVIAIAGAGVRMVPEIARDGFAVAPLPLVAGFVAAAVSGILAIRLFIALLRRQNFYMFAWYCWGAGTLFLFMLREG